MPTLLQYGKVNDIGDYDDDYDCYDVYVGDDSDVVMTFL